MKENSHRGVNIHLEKQKKIKRYTKYIYEKKLGESLMSKSYTFTRKEMLFFLELMAWMYNINSRHCQDRKL